MGFLEGSGGFTQIYPPATKAARNFTSIQWNVPFFEGTYHLYRTGFKSDVCHWFLCHNNLLGPTSLEERSHHHSVWSTDFYPPCRNSHVVNAKKKPHPIHPKSFMRWEVSRSYPAEKGCKFGRYQRNRAEPNTKVSLWFWACAFLLHSIAGVVKQWHPGFQPSPSVFF